MADILRTFLQDQASVPTKVLPGPIGDNVTMAMWSVAGLVPDLTGWLSGTQDAAPQYPQYPESVLRARKVASRKQVRTAMARGGYRSI